MHCLQGQLQILPKIKGVLRQVWETPTACFRHFKEAGYCIAATNLDSSAMPITDLDWTKPTAIVLGNESYGRVLTFKD